MKTINLAKSAGFCFGVKRALEIAFKTTGAGAPVYMLGDIVHNEEVVKQIEQTGIKKIKRFVPGKNKILLLRAHGTGLKTLQKAQRLGYKIVDATCPMVKEIHKIAKEMEQKGYQIVVIGDKIHDEVHGIIGQLKNKAIIIDSPQRIPLQKIRKIKRAAVVVQSTQDLEKATKIVATLKPYIQELKFFNTICRPTRTKQAEIKIMPLKNDLMIIIGSKTSANTKRLYEISRALNKNSYWIQCAKDVKRGWFKDVQSVGVTAGASTPEYTLKEVINAISYL